MTDTTTEALAAARAYRDAGMPVFVAPPNPGYRPDAPPKLPDGRRNPASVEFHFPEAYQGFTPDTIPESNRLEAWEPGYAVCLCTGYGIDGVDVDTKHGAAVDEQRERLQSLGARILAVVITPSGGAHFHVRSAGICSTSRTVVGVDYRGRGVDGSGGGLLYMPGTSRPKYAGAGYVWAEPITSDDLDDLTRDGDDADAVAAYLLGLGVQVRTHREHAPASEVGGEPLPAHLPPWLGELVGDLGPSWEAGPKDSRRLSSDKSERFHHLVAAARRAGLSQGQAVTLLDPWCAAVGKYVGRVAGEVARVWPKVEPEPGKVRPVVLAAQGKDSPGTPSLSADALEAEPWDDPVPLGDNAAPLVDISALPPVLREMVEAQTEQSQSPLEVVLGAAIGTIAAASRGVWSVQVNPGWKAGPTSLWVTTLAGSGERKGAGQDRMVAPLLEAERAIAADVRRANRNRDAERKRLAGAIKAAELEGAVDTLATLTESLHNARPRPVPGLVISDTTTEALGQYMTEQGGAVGIFSTEATAFRTVAGAYSDQGGNLGLLNHAYDGEPYSDLRIRRAGIRVDRPTLTWCTAVQPEVLAGYASSDTEGSGFLARFVMFTPESRVGKRSLRTPSVPEHVSGAWDAAVSELHAVAWARYEAMTADLPDEMGAPSRLYLDDDAAEALVVYAEQLEAAKVPGSALVTLGGWIEKHPARIARLAALLALLDNPRRSTVPLASVRAALSLADALVAHALRAFAVLREAKGREPEARTLEALRRMGSPIVSTREVYRAVQGQTSWVDSTADVRDALERLEVLGWVRGPILSTTASGGRPTERWAVHPWAVALSAGGAE